MKPISAPVAAEVRQEVESEAAMIRKAKQVLSNSSWQLGEIASQWTAAYARGRTDYDFGAAVGGMTGDQVNQRRRVWDRWGSSDIYRKFGAVLSWSHFYAALNWDDAESVLQWAYDNQATVAEMKAWRRAEHGDDIVAVDPATGDPFSDDDPFGEREGTGTEAGGEDGGTDPEAGTETGGTDSEEESGALPPGSGKDKRGGRVKPPEELFSEHKAKAVKTFEAGMRAVDSLHGLRKIPKHDEMIEALGKMIKTVKSIR